jgi:hypothetical protein
VCIDNRRPLGLRDEDFAVGAHIAYFWETPGEFRDAVGFLIRGEVAGSIRVDDDPHDLAKPRGKQDWQLEPHSIWYQRTNGIWQTVWLERVPPVWVGAVQWRASAAPRCGADTGDGLQRRAQASED